MAADIPECSIDLDQILRLVGPMENLRHYDIFPKKNLMKAGGFISKILTGEIFNKDNGETAHIVLKKAYKSPNSEGNELLYKNEINFYSKIFPELNKFQKEKGVRSTFNNIPTHLGAQINNRYMFLAFEDLRNLGYEFNDKTRYLNSRELNLIFKTYGKFHALSFAFKQINPEQYEDLVKDCTNILSNWTNSSEIVKCALDAFASALETFNSDADHDILEKLRKVDILETLKDVALYKGSYKCLVHGDCWSNNMLFKYKKTGELEDMKIVDFQGTTSNTPIHDLAYCFYSGAAKHDMDKLDYYLDVYYKSFSDFAKELGEIPEQLFPLEILKKEWKHYGLMGIFLGCQLWALKLIDEEDIENVLSRTDLPQETYWEKWNEILTRIRQGEEFRERARNICLHAVEYGIVK